MSPLHRFAQRRPILSYYALVFAIPWGGILFLAAPGGIPGAPEDVERLFPWTLAALLGVALWGVVGVIAAVRRGELSRRAVPPSAAEVT